LKKRVPEAWANGNKGALGLTTDRQPTTATPRSVKQKGVVLRSAREETPVKRREYAKGKRDFFMKSFRSNEF